MRREKSKINTHVLYYVMLFLFFAFYQTSRILQLKSPVNSILTYDKSYLLYGAIVLLVPLYIAIFIYLPSLFIIHIEIHFPGIQPLYCFKPVIIRLKTISNQFRPKPQLELLCIMRC